MIRKGFFIYFCLLLSSLTARTESPPTLAVYLPDYRVKSLEQEPKLYGTTHLILFSAKPADDGNVDFSRITPELLSFAEKARQKGPIKVTVCVGGWGRGKEFANAVATVDSRDRFVKSLVEFCETNQLDGVDLDWEYPKGDQQHADYTKFIAQLSTQLRAKQRILTAALAETRPLPEECWQHLDQVYLMSYQPWTPQPYEPWLTESVQRFLDSGLPPEKLIIGVGFFTKEKAGERRAVSWHQTFSKPMPKSEHGFWPVGFEPCDLRTQLMKQYQLGGVMVWDYGHDSPDPEISLLRHLSKQIKL